MVALKVSMEEIKSAIHNYNGIGLLCYGELKYIYDLFILSIY